MSFFMRCSSWHEERALKVIDGAGKTVGELTPNSEVVLELPESRVVVGVTASGFEESSVNLYYAAADCSGQALLPLSEDYLVVLGVVVDNRLYYPVPPVTSLATASRKSVSKGFAICMPASVSQSYGIAAELDVAPFGFAPPFRAGR